MEITKTAFLQIKGILERGHYDIDGLYEVGLPSDFYEKTGISDDLFNSFYKVYKDKSKDVTSNENVNVDTTHEVTAHEYIRGQLLNSNRFGTMDSFIESAIRPMYTTATLNTIPTSNTTMTTDTPDPYTVVTSATGMPHSYTYYV